jgi:hypothetical protein
MIEKITAGIDWLSASMPNTAPNYHDWRRNAYNELEAVATEGHQIRDRSLLGYVGHSAGNCFIGENQAGSFAQFTGNYGEGAYWSLYAPNIHVSRVDVQITTKLTVMSKAIAKEAYRDATLENKTLPQSRQRKLWIIVGSDGGDTFYLGSAASEQRARIYNKEVQSEDTSYTRCWRYEVVLRNDLAGQFALEYHKKSVSRYKYLLQFVKLWFLKRGVILHGIECEELVILPIERTRPTDVEKKLKWLEVQVLPTIKYLKELGFRDTLLELLQLGEPYTD